MFAPNDLTTLFKLLSLKCHELFMQSFWHDSSRIRTCDLRIKSPLLYQLSYRVYTKSLRSKDFSDPLTSIARRRGSNFSIDVSFNVFSLTKEDVGFEPTRRITT